MFPNPEQLAAGLFEDLNLIAIAEDSKQMSLTDLIGKIARRLWQFYEQSRSPEGQNGVSVTLRNGVRVIFTFMGWGIKITGPRVAMSFYPQTGSGEIIQIDDSTGLDLDRPEYYSGPLSTEYYSGLPGPDRRSEASLALEARITPLVVSYQRGEMDADRLRDQVSLLVLESFKTQGVWAKAINVDLAGTIYEFRYDSGVVLVRPWISPLEYQRQVQGQFKDSDQALTRWRSRFPEAPLDWGAIQWGTPGAQVGISDQDVVELQKRIAAIQSTERAITGPVGSNAAAAIWREHDGVICCECDDPDCFRVLTITYEEYLHASGNGGWYRVTHPECAWGVERATLMERNPHYYSWTKLRSD